MAYFFSGSRNQAPPPIVGGLHPMVARVRCELISLADPLRLCGLIQMKTFDNRFVPKYILLYCAEQGRRHS